MSWTFHFIYFRELVRQGNFHILREITFPIATGFYVHLYKQETNSS